MKSIGICIGASTISLVELRQSDSGTIIKERLWTESHHGEPKKALQKILGTLDLRQGHKIAITGRQFKQLVKLSAISETEAVENAILHFNGRSAWPKAVISAGAETFLVYVIGGDGRIASVQTGNKCASGTGEFFLQQIRRMGISLEEAGRLGDAEESYSVSGRCSVFCKSDCTHAANKGVPKERIVAGLCEMMAGKVLEIMKQVPRDNVMIIGGTTRNQAFVDHLAGKIHNLVVPEDAAGYEALGAAIWALRNETAPYPGLDTLFGEEKSSFVFLPPIADAADRVEFKTHERGVAKQGDRCILGLDVGSTTTKAILLRLEDDRILASAYLRTNGDPVGASRECYASLSRQLADLQDEVHIISLGVTGSGRYIAGLHAMTDGIINEIAAHATAALHFNPSVDTIFEIGGQDAKYTYLTNGVPSDYAMNEACSAGTGSFLEESAQEAFGIVTDQIGEIAMLGKRPPNFNDQCAAFISSDIKRALHESLAQEDVVAGLVYSICMNYHKRVKGSRPVGKMVFMQGGVCHNRAVPLAMASITGKRITVPPEPGLMGAYGVALEIKRRLDLCLTEERNYSLRELMHREMEYGKSFLCNGGKEKCDRKCKIARIRIDGRTFPFGGACNRWYNLRFKKDIDTEKLDHVARYEKMVFAEKQGDREESQKTIGISKSFFTNAYYPLYYHFFTALGFRILLAEEVEQEGLNRKGAPFCYPAEIAHGFLSNLLGKEIDYLFLPHFKAQLSEHGLKRSIACPISQAEPYYLRSAFKDHRHFQRLLQNDRILSPVIDFSQGFAVAEREFIQLAADLKCSRQRARRAYAQAVEAQKKLITGIREEGLRAIQDLEGDPDTFAVVIFGRSYNAFVSESHLGIPHKFASRGIRVIPVDMLPADNEEIDQNMYWAAGRTILKGAKYVARHPQLFGCYITNFSCGPDSFLITTFRDQMGQKPSLTLELDSHTADAGLETRIEAYIDIIKSHIELNKRGKVPAVKADEIPSGRLDLYQRKVIDSQGRQYSFDDPRVHVIFPCLGGFTIEAMAAAFKGSGVRATALPPADKQVLELGKSHALCRECLPLLLTTGSLIKYLQENPESEEILLYFMPSSHGPCRFGQYSIFVRDLARKLGIHNLVLYSPGDEKGYGGVGDRKLVAKIWATMVLADIMQDIYSVVLTNAVNKDSALQILRGEWQRILKYFAEGIELDELADVLRETAATLKAIQVKRSIQETPFILLTGEIYVRHDDLSRQDLLERLAEQGFVPKVASVLEWMYYNNWLCRNGLIATQLPLKEQISFFLKHRFMKAEERRMKQIMAESGLLPYQLVDLKGTIARARHLINPALTGEAMLTVGAALNEVPELYCGAIAIGPFGCMPNRVSEAILSREMNREGKLATGNNHGDNARIMERIDNLPFLAIETDGEPYPQTITARLEAFLLQAGRIHEERRRFALDS